MQVCMVHGGCMCSVAASRVRLHVKHGLGCAGERPVRLTLEARNPDQLSMHGACMGCAQVRTCTSPSSAMVCAWAHEGPDQDPSTCDVKAVAGCWPECSTGVQACVGWAWGWDVGVDSGRLGTEWPCRPMLLQGMHGSPWGPPPTSCSLCAKKQILRWHWQPSLHSCVLNFAGCSQDSNTPCAKGQASPRLHVPCGDGTIASSECAQSEGSSRNVPCFETV